MADQFWCDGEMRAAMETWHMGKVIRAFRCHPCQPVPISQEIAAGWAGLTQTQLSRIENGKPLDSLTKLTWWANTLRIPPDLLWFAVRRVAVENVAPQAGFGEDTTGHRIPDEGGDDVERRAVLRLLTMAGAGHNDGWLRFDRSRLPEERGACYLALNRPEAAEKALAGALTTGSTRRQASVGVDLAVVALQSGDIARVAMHAETVLDVARASGSGFVQQKLTSLRGRLRPYLGNRRARQLNEDIVSVCGGVR